MERYRTVRAPGDRLPLDVVEVIPEVKVRAIVQIVHGMREHKERYLNFMRFLSRRGIACVAADHRGYGNSISEPLDLEYFYDHKGNAIVNDLDASGAHLRLEYPHLPFVMIAHSMGTLVARKYLKYHDGSLNGLILSGPVWENSEVAPGMKLVDVLTKLMGDENAVSMAEKLSEECSEQEISGSQNSAKMTAQPNGKKAAHKDPLYENPFTLGGYRNLLKLIEDVYSEDGWKVKNPSLPVLLAAGEDDPVIAGPDEFEKQSRDLEEKGYTRVYRKLYPNMRHEILNEVSRELVYEDFYNFIQEIINRSEE